eukprot:CAMPEP_0172617492 /NCGR_PEP_ID=MMETSP1068-20121228/70285_1 /TAXON_ID=35684 /ORGANISM="Pseudopedinella elastica, Strain CCMP716" /LENGTH=134 /DNA_ID=CAMNT_0013423261 /DNA_START=21 /DNA_END=427 /DNA_ORIENTATION=+
MALLWDPKWRLWLEYYADEGAGQARLLEDFGLAFKRLTELGFDTSADNAPSPTGACQPTESPFLLVIGSGSRELPYYESAEIARVRRDQLSAPGAKQPGALELVWELGGGGPHRAASPNLKTLAGLVLGVCGNV